MALSLTEAQLRVVESAAPCSLVPRAPGRASRPRSARAPKDIIILTFSVKARTDLQERLASIIGAADARAVHVFTFHALGLKLLSAEQPTTLSAAAGARDWHNARPVILSGRDLNEAIRTAASSCARSDGALIKANDDEVRSLLQILELAKASAPVPRASVWALTVLARYERAKKGAGDCAGGTVRDYSDLILDATQLLVDAGSPAQRFAVLQRMLGCLHFVQQLLPTCRSLVAVGDQNQTIYGWRGAEHDPFDFLSLCVGTKNVQRHTLDVNFRSPREVVAAANAVLRSVVDGGGGGGASLEMHPGSSHAPILVLQCQSDRDEDLTAATQVRKLQRQGTPLNEVAILCRANWQASSLRATLQLEYQLAVSSGSLDGATRAQVLGYLQLALAPTESDEAFWSVLSVPSRGLGAVAEAYLRAAHAKVSQLALRGNSAGTERSVLITCESLLKRGFPKLPAPAAQAAARNGMGGRGGSTQRLLSMPSGAQHALRLLCTTVRKLETAVSLGKSPLAVFQLLSSSLDLAAHYGRQPLVPRKWQFISKSLLMQSPRPFEAGSAFANASSSAKAQPCVVFVQMRQMAENYSKEADGTPHARNALVRLLDDMLLSDCAGEYTVTTVHGAKGREWDHVRINRADCLRPLPSLSHCVALSSDHLLYRRGPSAADDPLEGRRGVGLLEAAGGGSDLLRRHDPRSKDAHFHLRPQAVVLPRCYPQGSAHNSQGHARERGRRVAARMRRAHVGDAQAWCRTPGCSCV
ncbi:P-loop containing nucleoside triphosphate hydrolase protein [Pavlovales sp. CCMP2436]|nr:P-loop containing nucleoside triphosphate hydrolase protein [Pavlovales sp. CCMP2436]